jgi:hypothetical protein
MGPLPAFLEINVNRIAGPSDLVSKLEVIQDLIANHDVGDNLFDASSEIKDLVSHLKSPGQGVNPVTIAGINPQTGYRKKISICRLWLTGPALTVSDGQQRSGIGVPPVESVRKDVTLIVWDGTDENPNILQVVRLEENDFTEALSQLFPLRELWVESSASKVNTDLLVRMIKGQ